MVDAEHRRPIAAQTRWPRERVMITSSGTGVREFRQHLNATPEIVGPVRRIVVERMQCWGWDEFISPATLCVTEMLTNVHRHVESDVCLLVLRCSPSRLRIVVRDCSPLLPVVDEPDDLAESGRGLLLLCSQADAWGAAPRHDGKDVWVEFLRT
ncbi:ATP-binding protein [Streptomyces sp. NPDC000618]|uniref:ATP-binding protein n=2 Tax=unclassified Streptomyces TaxID=2593676 RepID=UPI00333370E0